MVPLPVIFAAAGGTNVIESDPSIVFPPRVTVTFAGAESSKMMPLPTIHPFEVQSSIVCLPMTVSVPVPHAFEPPAWIVPRKAFT